MNTVIVRMACRLLVFLPGFLSFFSGYAQVASTGKNFLGLQANIGWATTTLSNGAFYERIVFSKQNKEAGIKLGHTSRYKYGNLILFSGGSNVSRTDIKLTASGYVYPNKLKGNTGFFISGELGASMALWKTGKSSITQLQPVVEVGLGWKWPLGNKMSIRWANALVYLHPSQGQPYNDGIITTSGIALGF
jgi:hypothetical protein